MFERDDPLFFEGEMFLYFAKASTDSCHIIRKKVAFAPPSSKYTNREEYLTYHSNYVFLVVTENQITAPNLISNHSASYLLEEE